MNLVVMIGNLVNDPERTVLQSGQENAKFRIAVRRNFKDKASGQYESDFVNCVAWGKTAEYVNNYLRKGNKVCIEGKLQTRTYDNQQGQKVYAFEIVAEHAENLTPREQAQQAPGAPNGFTDVTQEEHELPF